MKTINDVLQARDTINSKDASVTMTAPNGEQITLMESTKVSLKISKKKEQVKVLNKTMTGHKAVSAEGTGSLEGYLISSRFIKYALPFIQGGEDVYFDIHLNIEDPTSSSGRQNVTAIGANFDDVPIADISADDGLLQWKTDLTFEDMALNNAFNK